MNLIMFFILSLTLVYVLMKATKTKQKTYFIRGQDQSEERNTLPEKSVDRPNEITEESIQGHLIEEKADCYKDNATINKITEIIFTTCANTEKIYVELIARELCMSHATLYRKVKKATGMSVNSFIRKSKLSKSKDLLSTRQYTISEVAYMTGFSSATYFRQCFKTEYGISPSTYVKLVEKQQSQTS